MSLVKVENLNLKWLLTTVALISIPVFLSRIYEPSLSGDAAKYALIAKTMVKEGNFLIPKLGDELYLKKPPLFFWIIAISFKVFGFNEFAARLPTAAFAILSSVTLSGLIYRITRSPVTSLLTSAIFVMNFQVIRISTVVRFESFLLFTNLTVILLLIKPTLTRVLIAGLLTAGGVLVKGPFGLIGLLSALIYYSLFERDRLKELLPALVVGLLIPVIYFLYVKSQNPEFIKEFFNNQILGRITGQLREGTPRSFFFYERIILKHFWPWNLLIAILIFKALKRGFRPEIHDRKAFYLLIIFTLLIYIPLHFISLKFTRYSYYLYPLLSLLAAFGALSLNYQRKALKFALSLIAIYTLVAATCPCKFHKDKLKDLRPLVKVALENFEGVGIGKDIEDTKRYALLFYFDELKGGNKFLISKICKGETLLKFKRYCLIKGRNESPSSNYSKRMEWRH